MSPQPVVMTTSGGLGGVRGEDLGHLGGDVDTGVGQRFDHGRIDGGGGRGARGTEVGSTDQVAAATGRLKDAGLATFEEHDTSCCYAVQDKVWVDGPGRESWEVYVVKADAGTLGG